MQVDESGQDRSTRQKVVHGTDMELERLVMEAEFGPVQRDSDRSFLVQAMQDTDAYLDKNVFKGCKERDAVKKDLLQLGVHPSVHVAEVFSNPGKARFVHRFGLTPGLALDLRTGLDLNDPAQRAKMWSHWQRERPILTVGSWIWFQDDTHDEDD